MEQAGCMDGKDVQQQFLKFTAQKLKFHLLDNGHKDELEMFRSTQRDREYHFWERRPWRAILPNRNIVLQKLHYIHVNPVTAGLCAKEEDYLYSSAAFIMITIPDGIS